MEVSISSHDGSVFSCSLLGCDWFPGSLYPFLTYWVWVIDFWQDWFWPEYCWAKWINIGNFSAWSWRIVSGSGHFSFNWSSLSSQGGLAEKPSCCNAHQLLMHDPSLEALMGIAPFLSRLILSLGPLSGPAGLSFSPAALAKNVNHKLDLTAWRRERFRAHLFLWDLWSLNRLITFSPPNSPVHPIFKARLMYHY